MVTVEEQKHTISLKASRASKMVIACGLQNVSTTVIESRTIRSEQTATTTADRVCQKFIMNCQELSFPVFRKGDDPQLWIHIANQHFDHYQVPDQYKVLLSEAYIESEVKNYLKSLTGNRVSWEDWSWSLYEEFNKSHNGFNNERITGCIDDYNNNLDKITSFTDENEVDKEIISIQQKEGEQQIVPESIVTPYLDVQSQSLQEIDSTPNLDEHIRSDSFIHIASFDSELVNGLLEEDEVSFSMLLGKSDFRNDVEMDNKSVVVHERLENAHLMFDIMLIRGIENVEHEYSVLMGKALKLFVKIIKGIWSNKKDAGIWIIQFIWPMQDEKGELVRNAHLIGFIRRNCKMCFLRTKTIFVFDGGTPTLKRRAVMALCKQWDNAQKSIVVGLFKHQTKELGVAASDLRTTMAPEYALWGYLIYKSGVYSFGIVAMEIVSGRHNMSYEPEDDCTFLLDWACHLHKNNRQLDLVNQKLGSELNKVEAERIIQMALLCTDATPSIRPTMSEVVNMLEGRNEIPNIKIHPDDNIHDLRFKAKREHRRKCFVDALLVHAVEHTYTVMLLSTMVVVLLLSKLGGLRSCEHSLNELKAVPRVMNKKIIAFVDGLSREYHVYIKGVILVPGIKLTGTSQQVEIQVMEIFSISKVVHATKRELEIEDGLKMNVQLVRANQDNTGLNYRVLNTRTLANQFIFCIQCQVENIIRRDCELGLDGMSLSQHGGLQEDSSGDDGECLPVTRLKFEQQQLAFIHAVLQSQSLIPAPNVIIATG